MNRAYILKKPKKSLNPDQLLQTELFLMGAILSSFLF
jgi:hypothetical protein